MTLSASTFRLAAAVLVGLLMFPATKATEALYFPCQSCHGVDGSGNEASGAPALAGMEAAYFSRQMRHFRDGVRGAALDDLNGRQMSLVSALLDDEMIEALAAYVAEMPRPVLRRTLPTPSGSAEQRYVSCAACHGVRAEGNIQLKAPALMHLNDWYLARQLAGFASGVRGRHPDDSLGQAMAAASSGLTEAEILDLASYVASLAPDPGPDAKADAP